MHISCGVHLRSPSHLRNGLARAAIIGSLALSCGGSERNEARPAVVLPAAPLAESRELGPGEFPEESTHIPTEVTLLKTGSVFLAFAFLNPNFELMLFFILPVKIKWFALIQGVMYAYTMIAGSWPVRLTVLASLGNFLLFFAGEIVDRLRTGRRRMEHQARVTAARSAEREPRHRCVVCGKTELTHPLEDFRYGDDDQCYCSEHRSRAKSA